MWSLLKGEGHRIQQLHMTHVTLEAESVLALLQALPANALEHCKIDISMPENNRQQILSLFSGDGRRLRSLYLSRVPFLPSNTFPRLTSLILDLSYSREDPRWNLRDLQNFLAGSPDLERLHLSWVWRTAGPHPPNVSDDTHRVVLPHLRTFTLNLHSRFIGTAVPMILSIVELPHACQIQLNQVRLNDLQAMSPSLLSLGRPLTRMRLALGATFHDPAGSPSWDWSLVLASRQADCAAIRLVLEPVDMRHAPNPLGAAFSKLPLFADVEELWYSSSALLRQVLLPPKVRGLALSIQSWAPSFVHGYLAHVARVCAKLDTLCICVPNAEHLRDVREALTSAGPNGRPRCRAIRRVAVGYDRPSARLSRGAISLRDCGAGTEVSWTGRIARLSGAEMETEMERLLRAAPQVLEEPASIQASWPTWPGFLLHSY
ncbi:hypothetical protein GSI_09678 [Ganoderma sinense ZZ0214-1]|uniref:F-box domain-containing protein n=1 Tax=Ganoderma sinense ZZ0214-1 TaxID=1077348 RepID=A0A2G8S3B6_9APHY|nr:hypothetical protein GSI_09678 [Ganoderma sinense ZZ0214-1]